MQLLAARQAGTCPSYIGLIIPPFGISREKTVSDHKMYPVAEKFEFFATPEFFQCGISLRDILDNILS